MDISWLGFSTNSRRNQENTAGKPCQMAVVEKVNNSCHQNIKMWLCDRVLSLEDATAAHRAIAAARGAREAAQRRGSLRKSLELHQPTETRSHEILRKLPAFYSLCTRCATRTLLCNYPSRKQHVCRGIVLHIRGWLEQHSHHFPNMSPYPRNQRLFNFFQAHLRLEVLEP